MDNNIIRKLTHTRTETAQTITIVWNAAYTLTIYALIILAAISSFIGGSFLILCFISFLGIVLLFIYSIVNYSKAAKEIKTAAKNDSVSVSGNKYSINNPLTITIHK